jgi:hypothetical protein
MALITLQWGWPVHDYLTGARDIDVMLLRQPVVPSAVPGCQKIGILLKGSGELGTGQRLHVEEAVLVRVGLQLCLGHGARVETTRQKARCEKKLFRHRAHDQRG